MENPGRPSRLTGKKAKNSFITNKKAGLISAPPFCFIKVYNYIEGRKKVVKMAAFNDRRVTKERRQGDRRWLGIFSRREYEGNGPRKGSDRRMGTDRREKESVYSRIAF